MSMLLDFIGGVAGDFKRQIDDKEKRRLDYIERKRESAERARLAAEQRKQDRLDLIEQRKYDEGREGMKVEETFPQDGNLMRRRANGTTEVVRPLTAEELEDASYRKELRAANLALTKRNASAPYGGGGRGARDDEAKSITATEAKLFARALLGADADDEEVEVKAGELYSTGATREDMAALIGSRGKQGGGNPAADVAGPLLGKFLPGVDLNKPINPAPRLLQRND